VNQPFTLVTTVFNEISRLDNTIRDVEAQTVRPAEIVIVDAGSRDGTLERLERWRQESTISVKVIVKPKCNVAEGRNIAEDEVVKAILADNGFDPAVADRGMFTAADTYMRNLDEAVARGVFGVPFYIVGDERFWGQDRLDMLEAHLTGA
jgi:glycosyltransferase involved in cell wall biosynthesis